MKSLRKKIEPEVSIPRVSPRDVWSETESHWSCCVAAFGWNGTATFLGEALGVWIGGYFAIPSGRVPILGRLKLFEVYPFVLPSLVISFL